MNKRVAISEADTDDVVQEISVIAELFSFEELSLLFPLILIPFLLLPKSPYVSNNF